MNKLIVITGIFKSGTHELGVEISKKSNIDQIYIRDYYLDECKRYYFNNVFERALLFDSATMKFKLDIIKYLRLNKSLIAIGEFGNNWQTFFKNISSTYKYELIVIKCDTKDFENIWTETLSELKTINEMILHSIKYNGQFSKKNVRVIINKDVERHNYEYKLYTDLNGDKTYQDKHINEDMSNFIDYIAGD